jgi:integrase
MPKQAKVSWADAVRAWSYSQDGILTESYIMQVRATIERLRAFCGGNGLAVESTTLPQLNRFLDAEAKIHKSRPVKDITRIKAVASWLVGRGEIEPCAILHVAPRKYHKGVRLPATPQQVHRIAEALPPEAARLWRFLAYSGARFSCIATAQKANVRDGYLHVVGKGGKPLAYAIDATLAAILAQAPEGPYLFADAKGRPWDRTTFSLVLRTACKRAGIEHATPHQLRHLFATIVARQSGIGAAQAALAHSNAATTNGYVHLEQADADRSAAIARAVLAPPTIAPSPVDYVI